MSKDKWVDITPKRYPCRLETKKAAEVMNILINEYMDDHKEEVLEKVKQIMLIVRMRSL